MTGCSRSWRPMDWQLRGGALGFARRELPRCQGHKSDMARDEFVLELTAQQVPYGDGRLLRGSVYIGEFVESIPVCTSTWEPTDYVVNWMRQAAILSAGGDSVVFVTSVPPREDPDPHVFAWVAYRLGERVAFRNQFLPVESWRVGESGVPQPVIAALPRLGRFTSDGHEVSEWSLPAGSLRVRVAASW